jgi:hypothetical protein
MRDAEAAAASCWRCCNSCCALATSALPTQAWRDRFPVPAATARSAPQCWRFGLRSGGASVEFGAALFVGAAARGGAIQIERERVELLAIVLAFALDGIAALGALGVLAVHLLYGFALAVNFVGDFVELLLQLTSPRRRVARTCWPARCAASRASRRAAWRSARPSRPGASASSSGA